MVFLWVHLDSREDFWSDLTLIYPIYHCGFIQKNHPNFDDAITYAVFLLQNFDFGAINKIKSIYIACVGCGFLSFSLGV